MCHLASRPTPIVPKVLRRIRGSRMLDLYASMIHLGGPVHTNGGTSLFHTVFIKMGYSPFPNEEQQQKVHLMRQISLKPQDVVASVWLACTDDPIGFSFARFSQALAISTSEAHAAVQRCMLCGLINKDFGELQPNRSAIMEFVTHGIRYVYPPIFGQIAQGMRTSAFTGPLETHFPTSDTPPIVWPDPEGTDRGMSLCPLYPSIPTAAKRNPRFYEVAAILDAIRAGSAREREIARSELQGYIR